MDEKKDFTDLTYPNPNSREVGSGVVIQADDIPFGDF